MRLNAPCGCGGAARGDSPASVRCVKHDWRRVQSEQRRCTLVAHATQSELAGTRRRGRSERSRNAFRTSAFGTFRNSRYGVSPSHGHQGADATQKTHFRVRHFDGVFESADVWQGSGGITAKTLICDEIAHLRWARSPKNFASGGCNGNTEEGRIRMARPNRRKSWEAPYPG